MLWHKGRIGGLMRNALRRDIEQSALRSADRSRAPANRDALLRQFMAAGGELSHEKTVTLNRSATA
jgi:8-hydroxy-5-deazaflavin:NADPH oxidoreductase